MDFRVNKHRYISAHGIAKALGNIKAEAEPFFHALIGCHTILFFNGMGKKESLGNFQSFIFFIKDISRISKLS